MKPKREITLGEMQDECKKRDGRCVDCHGDLGMCSFSDIGCCRTPRNFNLSDPPQFNEAQMALLKALYVSGVVKIAFGETIDLLRCLDAEYNMTAGLFWERIGLPREELDLAELFGKESA